MVVKISARRCWLFVPGDSSRKMGKAAQLDVDCVILDLEDAIAVSQKETARQMVLSAVNSLDFGSSECYIRVNGPGTDWFTADMAAAGSLDINGIVVSKVNTAEQLQQAAQMTSLPLFALIESGLAVMNLREIGQATPQLAGLFFGGEDLTADLGATSMADKFELFFARSAVITAAAAYGLQAVDMVYTDFNNMEGLALEALVAHRLGYTGKMAIHPDQVEVIQRIFSPTADEIKQAKAIVEAYKAHAASGEGVFAIDGRMVDGPVVRKAEKMLAKAIAAGLLDG